MISEAVINTTALPEVLLRLIPTEKVRVKEIDGVIQLMPVKENIDCTIGLRGMFADAPELTVDKYLERKRVEKELDL